MRQVRTCDFCGDDATGVYEPLPSSIPDAPRMLLCDACRDRLSSVVDPLLARVGSEVGGDADGGGDLSGSTARDSSETSAYRDLDDGPRGDDAGGPAGDDLEAREWPADQRERAGEGSAGAATGRSGAEEPAEATDDAGDASETPDEMEAPPTAVDDLADDGDVDVSESRDASGRTQRERGGAPRGYRKVLRFLENRQLPVDRAEAERLASEAYDLDVGEVGAAIDHAVQYGRLREVSGELRR